MLVEFDEKEGVYKITSKVYGELGEFSEYFTRLYGGYRVFDGFIISADCTRGSGDEVLSGWMGIALNEREY